MHTNKKVVVITQSNYIPWKGYFDFIRSADHVIWYDDMQYTRRDWRNRNQIKTKDGLQWLTIPVDVKGKFYQKICETKISDPDWYIDHLNQIYHSYKKAKCFEATYPFIEKMYQDQKGIDLLSFVNDNIVRQIASYLGITLNIEFSMNYSLADGKTERLVDLCEQLNATDYVSGPAAKSYIDPILFEQANIKLHYVDYSGYPTYEQLHGDFVHGVSILDLLLNKGGESLNYCKKLTYDQN